MKRVNLDWVVTFAERAKELGVTVDTIYKRANQEKEVEVKIGGRRFIYRDPKGVNQ
jgi:hypothetical protein